MAYVYYSLKRILQYHALYYIIFGERSNGKTYAVLLYGLKQYIKSGKQLMIIRRYDDDYTGNNGRGMFDNLVHNGAVSKHTNGEWDNIIYRARAWYLARKEEDGTITTDETPLALGFALNKAEHYKSSSYPKAGMILFDELLATKYYLTDEFKLFCSIVSTIVRNRRDIPVFMVGNTVNRYCPYFREMGLVNVKKQKPGTIDYYKYPDPDLRVAVEYTASGQSKDSDSYFAFNNPKLKMITTGEWEIADYPHCPVRFEKSDIRYTYFIDFDSELFQCEIVYKGRLKFTFIHPKTTPLKLSNNQILYTTEFSAEPNVFRDIANPRNEIMDAIYSYFQEDRVFFSDNQTGDTIHKYLEFFEA